MPKPRFEPKQKVRAIGMSTSPNQQTAISNATGQVQLSLASGTSPVAGDSGNQVNFML